MTFLEKISQLVTRVWFVCVLNSTLLGKLKVKRWLWRKDNQKIGSGEARKGRDDGVKVVTSI